MHLDANKRQSFCVQLRRGPWERSDEDLTPLASSQSNPDLLAIMVAFIKLLPQHVACSILSSWLYLEEVGRLDSALCVHNCRNEFGELLSTGNWSCDRQVQNYVDNPSFVIWIMKWKVPLRNIFIGKRLQANDELRTSLLQVIGKSLRTINSPICCYNLTVGGVPTDIANYCTNLEECALESNKDDCDEFVLTILARNPKLRVLTLHCKDTLLLRAFQTVPNLVELTVGRASWTELDTVLDSYLQQLPATLKRLCWPAAACDGEYWLDRLFPPRPQFD